MISRIIKVSVRVISLSLRLRLITLTSTLIILDITKTESNNCFNRKRKETAVTNITVRFRMVYLTDLTFRMLQHTSSEVTVTKYDEI